ncbi:PIG-L deacetylase family protein [Ornithinibacillus xuwenensis]|uniref:PIG-L family deacetylase n=1 Tax=Ornithinibacillus xuwenensis TaxID=3144668 RepID=A0ABU9XK72_9BACI
MNKVLVIAPHPDDETLGCGGTVLRHKQEKDEIHWLIVTGISEEDGFTKERITTRDIEIDNVSNYYNFDSTTKLNFPTTRLDEIPMGKLVASIGEVVNQIKPTIIYLPYRGDIHTDHKYVFDAVISCTKWFRYESIKKILVYETLSETEFGINPDNNNFRPNVYVNIENYFNKKVEIMKTYKSELGEFPFPRSIDAMDALAKYRGVTAGVKYAEAFMLLKEIR